MNIKVFGGVAIGTIVGGGITYALCKKIAKADNDKHQSEIDELRKTITERDSEINSIAGKNTTINTRFNNLVKIQANTVKLYEHAFSACCKISDVNMIADIASINNIEDRDECLSKIADVINDLEDVLTFNEEFSDSAKVSNLISKIDKDVDTMCLDIKDIINNSENDDDDDDDDISEIKITPKRIILKCIDGTPKVFDTDPDDGFEILDGSDPENNDYCIIAQNVPALYNFLFASVKKQLASHYVSKIDPEVFESLIEDMVITVSLAYINEDDTVITSVDAVVPFEIFGGCTNDNEYKIYSIEEGELNLGNIIHYFRSDSNTGDIQVKPKELLNASETPTAKKEVLRKKNPNIEIDTSLSDNNIQFIIESIGFNREALKAFIGKLNILLKTNPEAGESIKNAFIENIREIHILKDSDSLNDNAKMQISNSIRAIISNMKKNYGASIRAYSQKTM